MTTHDTPAQRSAARLRAAQARYDAALPPDDPEDRPPESPGQRAMREAMELAFEERERRAEDARYGWPEYQEG